MDHRKRIQCAVFSVFPYQFLKDVVFIQPDTGVYPRQWHHTERPQVDASTLRLKDMWSTAIANQEALVSHQRLCFGSNSFVYSDGLSLSLSVATRDN